VDHVQFGILSNDEITKLSVVNITAHDIYDKGIPRQNGLGDLRLGTIDRQFTCQTCHQGPLHCPGHFGHIELAMPVYHILYMKSLAKVLQCICFECNRIIINCEKAALKPSIQSRNVYEICKGKSKCVHCEAVKRKIIIEKYEIFSIDEESKTKLYPHDIESYINKIDRNDLKLLGFFTEHSHPANFIIKNLLVPPPHVRPSVVMDASLRSQDDLTHKLTEIVKTNNLMKKTENKCSKEYVAIYDLLQFHVSTYIDNGIPGIPQATQRTGRPLKAICQRLKSKEGRVRGNLMGKRVNFSARTVITAEPNIDLDELGVPWKIAQNMTFPETVTSYNKKILESYVENGPDPAFGNTGAKFVKQNGIYKDLRFVKNIELNTGDIVERHIKDGDLVIFNRQPSLHKMSMMGHKIKIMNHSTFRMNLSATNPYNADFDGDEMNIFVPQNYQTKAEIQEIMMVSKNIVSPQSNKPVMGIIQDALIGSHKLTLKSTFVEKEIVHDICMKINNFNIPPPCIYKPEQLWSGKQLIQLLLPNDFCFTKKNALYDQDDNSYLSDGVVIIENGILIYGNLCKKTLGTSEGSIIHQLWLDYGPDRAKRFISDLQYVVNAFLIHHGFSIGAMDIFVDPKTEKNVESVMQNCTEKVNSIINLAKNSKQIDISLYEKQINSTLNNAMSQSGKIVKENITLQNNINSTVTSGSKGSILNIAQIMGCVGQQNVNGKRVEMGYEGRVLPHFEVNDIGPEAKGFVKQSYKKGLKPYEFFFHAMGGREGIIDTAVKTSETGYIQRRLVKSMEDLQVQSDYTVRNGIGDVVQFAYGDDCFDATYLISYEIPFIKDFANYTIFQKQLIEEIYEKINMKNKILFRSPLRLKFYKTTSNSDSDIDSYLKSFIELVHKLTPTHVNTEYIILQIISHDYSSVNLKIIHNYISQQYRKSFITPGDMVGTLTAQSLGEPVTQLTLNTFHSAGISAKNVTLGVPRFKELINVAKNIKSPSMKLYTLNDLNNHDLAAKIEYTTLNMFIEHTEIKSTIDSPHSCWFDSGMVDYYISFRINKNKLISKNVDLCSMCFKLCSEFDDNIVVYCSTSHIFVYIHNEALSDEYISEDDIRIFASKIRFTNLGGIYDVKQTYVSNDFIETDGAALQNCFQYDEIDPYKSVSNNIIEIRDLLGIEAARSVLLQEIKNVLEFDGTYINQRHFLTLVDTMTYKGDIMAITRHGINRGDAGPLMKCSFEETVDVLCDAGQYAEKDKLKGITESITLGKLGKMGTGSIELLYNIEQEIEESIISSSECTDAYFDDIIEDEESYFGDI
jgi:DNA-directed RNA polymerase II subunit RPB1